MVRTRRYIYSPRDGQDLNLSSKEKRLSLLNQSRNLTIELDKSIEQPKKKSKKNDKSKFKELIPKSPTTTANTSINGKRKNRKQKKKVSPRRSIFNKSLSSKSIDSLKALKRALNKSLNKMNQNKKYKNSFNSSSEKVIKKKKRQHSLEVSSENAVKKKRRKIEPFVTSTPLNKGIVKRVNRRKNKNKTVQKDQISIYNPEYHLHSTLKLSENRELTDNRDIIDITSPQPKNHPFVTLSETPINQHLSINLTPNIYKKLALNMPDIIEIDDDEEVQTPGPEIDYVNLLSPSVNGDESVKDDDSCIIIDDTPNKTAGTQMTPRSSYHHDRVIEIGTQITPHQTNVSTNTSKFTYSQVVGTKSVQTVTTANNNVVTQSTSTTSIVQISKNLHQSTSPAQKKQPNEQQQQRITPQNFNFQQNNGVISDFVQRIKQLEDQFIKHALLPQNEQNTQNNQTNSNYIPKFGSNIYNPKQVVKRGLRLIVIDGSNVAMGHSNGKYFSCEGLKICIDYFLKRGHEVKAFVPQYRRQHHQSSNPELLEHLAKCNLVIFTPSRQVNGRLIIPYDDRYIVQCAAERGGVIVSNDNYRDLLAENPAWRETITKRLLMWTWCGDMIMFPIDPCGRGGPSLDAFLRF